MPRYVIDEARLRANLAVLKHVADSAGVRILLAQKAFSCAATYPICAEYLAGTTSSSLHEALHAHRHFPGGEVHIFNPAFSPTELPAILGHVDHIVFNSPRQIELYVDNARRAGVSPGLRVNPGVSVATMPIYDPCRPGSRLGCSRAVLDAAYPNGGAEITQKIDGLHFHALCEQGLEELRIVLAGFERNFGDLLPALKWVNFGGGHHITRKDYDVEGLIALLRDFRDRYPNLTVYLEPGEAVALDAGTLEASVLEIQTPDDKGITNAILDVSAECHAPDVLETPYTPDIIGAVIGDAGPFVYRFGGPTCLAGDEIGVYSFPQPLQNGSTVIFENMAIYSMVKNNTFNGINLPDIALRHLDGSITILRSFGYNDFAARLG